MLFIILIWAYKNYTRSPKGLVKIFGTPKGSFKKYVTRRGARGLYKKVTKTDMGGRGYATKSAATLKKYI